MNKFKLTIYFSFLIFLSIHAQIGVNTNNPQTIFHVDASGNNPATGVATTANSKDDFFIGIDNGGQANIGIGILPASDTRAQLELAATNKAFLTNSVKLTGKKDLLTIPSPIDGMFVYNNGYAGTSANSVVPGLYYFEGAEWHLVLTSALGATMNLRDLQTEITTTQDLNASTQVGAEILDFGNVDIYESGSYAYAFRLYGPTANDTSTIYRGMYYIWLFVNGTLVDFAELNTPVFTNKQPISYSVILGATINAGDAVTFKFSRYGQTGFDYNKRNWTLTAAPGQSIAKTTMLFWKL